MKIVETSFAYKVYDEPSQMSKEDQALMEKAIEQLDHAYAPYSNFHVGAAVRLSTGEVFIGSNQENASYPLCMCGERVALYNAAAHRPKIPVEKLAIVIRNLRMKIDKPVSPCGACRQVIAEYEHLHGQNIQILLKSDGLQVYEIDSIKDLLPLGFDNSFL
ncbi:MAG: cytidine deaminase [Lewinellaceae bacterium]|nr:cytidine deaminase [Lewinellaceae bacterium]